MAYHIDFIDIKTVAVRYGVSFRETETLTPLSLKSGLTLNQGIAAARSLFGQTLNPLDTAKAVGWFKDGDLESELPGPTKSYLVAASANFDPKVVPLPIKSRALAPARQRRSDDLER